MLGGADVCGGVAGAEDGLDVVAGASTGAVLVDGSDIDEGADEGNIQDNGDEGGEGEASQAAQEQEADGGVEDAAARDTLNCPEVNGDVYVVIRHGGQVIGGKAQDKGSAAKLHAPVEPLYDLED